MIILKDSTYTQNFKFMPRSENIASMVFIDELTNESHELDSIILVRNGYYLQFESDLTFDFLVDGHTYRFNCFDSNGDTLYRDNIICTNQDIADYTINNGAYVAHTTTNEFVIYE